MLLHPFGLPYSKAPSKNRYRTRSAALIQVYTDKQENGTVMIKYGSKNPAVWALGIYEKLSKSFLLEKCLLLN